MSQSPLVFSSILLASLLTAGAVRAAEAEYGAQPQEEGIGDRVHNFFHRLLHRDSDEPQKPQKKAPSKPRVRNSYSLDRPPGEMYESPAPKHAPPAKAPKEHTVASDVAAEEEQPAPKPKHSAAAPVERHKAPKETSADEPPVSNPPEHRSAPEQKTVRNDAAASEPAHHTSKESSTNHSKPKTRDDALVYTPPPKKKSIQITPPPQDDNSPSTTSTEETNTSPPQPPSLASESKPAPKKKGPVEFTSSTAPPPSESEPTENSAPKSSGSTSKVLTGARIPDKPGRVKSPYPPYNELDVAGLPSGSLAMDPTTQKVFRVP